MVILYYSIRSHQYGEGVSLFSIIQAVGFVLMLMGTTTHNNIGGFGEKITSCCKKPEDEVNNKPLIANETEEDKK